MRAGALGASVLLSTLSTCARAPEPEPPPTAPVLEVEYAGCQEVRPGPVCELAEGAMLTVWAQGPAGVTLELGVDLGPSSPTTSASTSPSTPRASRSSVDPRAPWLPPVGTTTQATPGGGTRWAFVVPAATRAVIVRGLEGAAEARVLIPVGRRALPPALAEVDRLRAGGQFAEAEAALASLFDDPRPDVQTRVLGKRARLAMAQGRLDEAVTHFHAAIARARAEGLRATEINDRAALGYALLYSAERFADADAVLRPLEELAREVPQGRTTASYFLGLLDHDVGDLRGAADELGRARAQAERLGLAREARAALDMEIDVLATLGQVPRAQELMTRLAASLSASTPPCDRAHVSHNLAVYQLTASPARPSDDVLTALREAWTITRDVCRAPDQVAQVGSTLAMALTKAGLLDEAKAVLSAIPARFHAEHTGVVRAEAELALARGDHERAASDYRRIQRLTPDVPHVAWTAALGLARASLAGGQPARALEALGQAEDILDSASFFAPFGGGRTTYLDRYSDSSRVLADLHVAEGRLGDAAGVIRRAHRRGLAAIAWRARLEALTGAARQRWYAALEGYRAAKDGAEDEARRDWTMSTQRLEAVRQARQRRLARITTDFEATLVAFGARLDLPAAPPTDPPGTLTLLLYDGESGPRAIASLGEEHVAFAMSPDAGSTSRALEPLAHLLPRAGRVRVIASGSAARIDVHALPHQGAPLVATVPVVYALDLPSASSTTAPTRQALVVSDPRGDLHGASEERAFVTPRLVGLGLSTDVLSGDDATPARMLRALRASRPSWLHLATHGAYAGIDGWDSHLLLAQGTLTLSDILSADLSPRFVILSGCNTAKTSATRAAAPSIAHALVLAGAQGVVATTRAVRDTDAAEFMRALYASPEVLDLPTAFVQTQRGFAQRSSPIDWASFRLIVPE